MYRILLLLFITKIGYSQTIIKGEVIDGQTSETLIGANILIKGAKVGTATDYNGNFILETTKQLPLTLEITYLGYKNKAFREYKREQERVKQWKEAEKVRIRKAKQTKKLLKAIAAHVLIVIILIAIYYLL